MKKPLGYVLTVFLIVLCIFASWYYFYCKYTFGWNTDQLNLSRMITVSCYCLFFFGLLFSIDFEIYKQIFKFTLIFGLLVYIFLYSFQFFIYIQMFIPAYFWNFIDILMMISFSILAQGIIIYIIRYIKTSTAKYENHKFFGKYHLHEGLVGLALLMSALAFWILRSFLLLYQIFTRELSILLAINQIILFLLIYLGGFFVLRDINDITKMKFVEIKVPSLENERINDKKPPVFSKISEEDIHFFKFPKITYYPYGILLTSFAINAIVFGNGYLPQFIFHLENETVIILGYFLSFISGSLIGRDWFRIFKRFYPDLYSEIEAVIKNLRQ